jgi:hypothetical protein
MNHDNGRLTHPPGEKRCDKKNVAIGLSKPIEHQLVKQNKKITQRMSSRKKPDPNAIASI